MNTRSLLAASAAVAGCLTWLWAGPPATRPAPSRPTTAVTAPADLAGCIRAIRGAADTRAAMAAYARGCSINRNSLQLQEAYVLAMLRFGRPKIALFPARKLLAIKPSHPMAWAVVGYDQAKRKRLAKALEATLRAAQKLPDNPGVLHNAGQLLAWYENQTKPPAMSDASIQVIQKAKASLAKNEFFARARKKIQAAYDEREQLRKQHQTKVDAAKGEAEEILEAGKEIDRALADLADEIKSRKQNIADLRREYRRLRDKPEGVPTAGRRATLNFRITEERRRLKKLEDNFAAVRLGGQQVLAKLRRKLVEVKRLERDMKRELARKPIRFRWDPPAVGGVVTPEGPRIAPTSTAPTATGSKDQLAEARLRMADLYLKNHMPEKAAKILNKIIATYPKTAAAAKAKSILAKLKPGK